MRQDWFKIIEWPDRIVEIALKPHKFNLDRLNFVVFLKGNGLDPHRIWVYLRYMDKFDSGAKTQLGFLINNSLAQYNYTYWDMIQRRYLRIGDVVDPLMFSDTRRGVNRLVEEVLPGDELWFHPYHEMERDRIRQEMEATEAAGREAMARERAKRFRPDGAPVLPDYDNDPLFQEIRGVPGYGDLVPYEEKDAYDEEQLSKRRAVELSSIPILEEDELEGELFDRSFTLEDV
jgi:hypothetical protein